MGRFKTQVGKIIQTRAFKGAHSLIRFVAIGLIRLYQIALSPYFGQHCRFYPSCSEYTKQAIDRFGLLKGGFFGIRRVLRCQPFSAAGFDPLSLRVES